MAKGIMVIDGQRVPFDGERNVLAVIRKAGIDIPTFCYYSDLSVHGACRMCIVEDVKTGKIDASCSMEPRDGMEIRTNTARLLRHRRMILELMLASHDCSCTTCAKSGNCRLQALAQRFGVSRVRFPDTRERYEQDNRKDHDEIFVAVVAVVYGYGPKAAAPQRARHGGVGEYGGGDYRRAVEQRGRALGQQHPGDYLEHRRAHALSRLYYAVVHLLKGAFHHAAHIWRRRYYQRGYYRCGA